jgi:uncharacterized membrane protein
MAAHSFHGMERATHFFAPARGLYRRWPSILLDAIKALARTARPKAGAGASGGARTVCDPRHQPTKNRTGVLIFVSLAEHYARIVADEGIAAKVQHADWQEAIDTLTAHMHDGQITAGLVAAVQRCGEVLAINAPPDDSPNELPDRLYVV